MGWNDVISEYSPQEEEQDATLTDKNLSGWDAVVSQYDQGTTKDEPYAGVTNTRKDKLKKDDLLDPQNLRIIRNYMGQKYGRDALKSNDEELVEKFVDSMRWFNGNIASTITEARRIKNANQDERSVAGDAFDLYDRLGNVFVNDGVMGAVDGVKDYFFAAAADPTNYLGLLTGGVAKASAVGVGEVGKQAVKALAKQAGEEALKKGLSKEAQQAAVDKAVQTATQQITKRAIREPARKKLLKEAAKRESELYEYSIKRRGEEAFMQGRIEDMTKKSLYATTAIDATAAVLHDVQIQNTMMEVGSQEEYSVLQTAFSSLLGGVGGTVQLAAMGLNKAGDLKGISADIDIGKMSKETTTEINLALDKEETKQATKAVLDAAKSWKEKVARGRKVYDDVPTSVDLIKNVMFGEDGTGGLVKIYKDKGVRLPQNMTVSDLMTNLTGYMGKNELDAVNKEIKSLGISLGDTTQVATNLRDLMAIETSKAGQVLNVMSQVRRTIDGGIYRGQQVIEEQTKEAMEEVGGEADYGRYMQGLWRRMLVSSPATSAVNLLGFAQYYGGTSIADVLTGTQLMAAGFIKGGPATKAGRETLRQAAVYKDMVTQKLRYLADPFTTKDAYMKILEDHEGMRKTLYESLTGGVDLNADRYNINKNNPLFKNLEAMAEGSSIIAGVRAQDTLTKSIMFMSELDKQARLKHKTSLNDILRSGDMDLLDEEIMGATLDQTLKSVFSKDYTKGQNSVVEGMAQTVESISRAPLLGTIIPFGRFFNNVLASSYQWTAGGMLGYMGALKRRAVNGKPIEISDVEALSRSTVGLTFMTLSMQYDEERRKDNLGTFDVKVGDTIFNAQNTFPMSLFLSAGRLLNDKKEGRPVSAEVWTSTLEQLAVGQLASDVEFKNDIRALGEAIFSQEGGQGAAMADALYKKGGNFLAGFTRPLDAANKMVGLVANNDAAKDVRQETGLGVLTQSSSKYVDNLLEAIMGETESITGEELRVATRDGSIRDPNPFLSAIGIKLKPGRTGTEELLDKLDIPYYKTNERTEIAAYDKALNETIAPILNTYAEDLLNNPEFNKLKPDEQSKVWRSTLSKARKDMRDYLENAPTNSHIEAVRRKAAIVPKVHKQAALRYLKEEEGFTGSIKDMTYPELNAFFTYVDYHKAKMDW